MYRGQLTTWVLALGLAAVPASLTWHESRALAAPAETSGDPDRLDRGAYLVRIMGCNHCHTPYKVGPHGPEPATKDYSYRASKPAGDGWVWSGAATNTAFSGPWGVSFAAHLTPDAETGLGKWTEEMFIATMKTGRHLGKGRQILPPMPYENLGNLSDEDIKSLFAYLQSLAPVRNRVPSPIDAPEVQR